MGSDGEGRVGRLDYETPARRAAPVARRGTRILCGLVCVGLVGGILGEFALFAMERDWVQLVVIAVSAVLAWISGAVAIKGRLFSRAR